MLDNTYCRYYLLRHVTRYTLALEQIIILWFLCKRVTALTSIINVLSNEPMMTSSNGNIFRVSGHLCREFPGHRWIPHTRVSDETMFSLICVWINGWANNREAGDLRRYPTHYDVTVIHGHKTMFFFLWFKRPSWNSVFIWNNKAISGPITKTQLHISLQLKI